jgi:hypothetical protein
MTDQNAQLVQRIADEVIAALRARSPRQGSPAEGPNPQDGQGRAAAAVRPPIGVCTGDYTQFPELMKRGVGARPPARPDSSSLPPRPEAAETPRVIHEPKAPALPPPLTGVVTGRRLDGVTGGIVHIHPKATVTPLARDVIRERGLSVRWADDKAANPSAAASADLLWWIDGQCPAVDRITTELRNQLTPVPAARGRGNALVRVIREVSQRVGKGEAGGAILFVPTAARPVAYANRCGNLRAIVGTCEGAVDQGVEQLAANVLVLEYPYHGHGAMRGMVDRFLAGERKLGDDVAGDLEELRRCG